MKPMPHEVVTVRPLAERRLWLQFEDGSQGEIDLAESIAFRGVFEPLQADDFFRQVRVNAELGVIEWPNGADLDSDVLYSTVTSQPLPGAMACAQS